ncbi:MAG: hypothetical protein KDE46_31050 [Caldilineaceae bacterium]|nr:hypothetical protein [Caldilineaceae bacterium]
MTTPPICRILYQYTATVLAIQASVSIQESDSIDCHCGLLLMENFYDGGCAQPRAIIQYKTSSAAAMGSEQA